MKFVEFSVLIGEFVNQVLIVRLCVIIEIAHGGDEVRWGVWAEILRLNKITQVKSIARKNKTLEPFQQHSLRDDFNHLVFDNRIFQPLVIVFVDVIWEVPVKTPHLSISIGERQSRPSPKHIFKISTCSKQEPVDLLEKFLFVDINKVV